MSTYDAWKAGEIGGNDRDPRSPAYDPRDDEARAERADKLMADPQWLRRTVSELSGDSLFDSCADALALVAELHEIDPSELDERSGNSARNLYVQKWLRQMYEAAKQLHMAARERAEAAA